MAKRRRDLRPLAVIPCHTTVNLPGSTLARRTRSPSLTVSAVPGSPLNLRQSASTAYTFLSAPKSGVCNKHQRMLSEAIKRARIMALIPFVVR